MQLSVEQLKKLLVAPGHISEADFEAAAREAETKEKSLEDVLVSTDLIEDEQLGQLVAEEFGYKLLNLKREKVDEDVFHRIPPLVARSREVVAIGREKLGVRVGMTNPGDLETRHLVEKRLGEKVVPYYLTKSDLEIALLRYRISLKEEFEELLEHLHDPELSREEKDKIIVKMVDMLLEHGYENKASDIHIEPREEEIAVRFRIDGILHEVLTMPKEFADLILTRLKILAKLRTDEHRAAQDGKFIYHSPQEAVDVRISVVPITHGENVVMRLLSAQGRKFSLHDLGFSDTDLEKLERAIQKPHGMILVTGPTGSGKTTTLYALLKVLNREEVHIATIEDPVEYDLEGVSQIQVNPRTNLTFAKGLRAIVRQDPDIIMVGEIRDPETAGIAINSAMTGHLVLSTLHANDAATTLPRLLDMGIEPFLVASTINVIVAQRLVRIICEACKVSYEPSAEEKKLLEFEPALLKIFEQKGYRNLEHVLFYKGIGCKVCGQTGYAGRIGIFEVLEMGEEVRALVVKRAPSDEIMNVAIRNGMVTMLHDGIGKVLGGVTTLQEVLRVTKE